MNPKAAIAHIQAPNPRIFVGARTTSRRLASTAPILSSALSSPQIRSCAWPAHIDGLALATPGELEPASAPYRATITSRLRDGRVPSNARTEN